jgi:hypothetical protein
VVSDSQQAADIDDSAVSRCAFPAWMPDLVMPDAVEARHALRILTINKKESSA